MTQLERGLYIDAICGSNPTSAQCIAFTKRGIMYSHSTIDGPNYFWDKSKVAEMSDRDLKAYRAYVR